MAVIMQTQDSFDDSLELSRQAMMSTYAPPDLVFTHGEGPYLYTESGERYLDFISGIAVNSFGHCHPYLVETLQQQAAKLWHVSNMFRISEGERLSRRLAELTFADKVFFTNSGTEALECGIKMMRRYHFDRGQPQRYRIIGFSGAFHGRTIAAISAAGNAAHTKGFVQGDTGYDHVEFGDLAQLENILSDKTAGIAIEPIQGEGGIRPASTEFLQALRRLCDEHGILLFFDEVQCGVGRTGKLYAYEWHGVTPDILATAKGIGGGFPVGACIATEDVAASMVLGTHGTTFGGNPLAMAVGNAILDLVTEPGFLTQVQQRGEELRQHLQDLASRYPQHIAEIRGQGLMLGIRCITPNGPVITALRQAGLLTGKAGDNVIRLLPPLNIDSQHIQAAIAKLDQVFTGLA